MQADIGRQAAKASGVDRCLVREPDELYKLATGRRRVDIVNFGDKC